MRSIEITLFLLAAIVAVGCQSNVEKHFGEAYGTVTTQMVANPDAGKQPADGVTVLEGETVENVMSQYRRGQTGPKDKGLPQSMLLTASPGK